MKRLTFGALLLGIGLLQLQFSPASSQGIRKIVDANGVTYFTNEPPENDPPAKPMKLASAPVAAVTVGVGAAPASPAESIPKLTPSGSAASKPDTRTPPQTTPSKMPLNPAQALGDWPPKSMQAKPSAPN